MRIIYFYGRWCCSFFLQGENHATPIVLKNPINEDVWTKVFRLSRYRF